MLRRLGFRFIALADDNFYPVTLEDLAMASRRHDKGRLAELQAMRAERFELMDGLAKLPEDMVFYTQITMEAAEDPEFLAAMTRARIRGALIGVEAVTPEGLKDVYKDFNMSGERLVDRLRAFRHHGIHVLGSFIFGLPSDRPQTFDLTAELAERSGVTFAQFVMLTPFPGTVDFAAWEKTMESDPTRIDGHSTHAPLADPERQAAQGVRAASRDVARRNPHADAGACGIASTAGGTSGRAPAASNRSRRASRSCWSRSCTGRCTRTPGSPPTARASTVRRTGRAGSPSRCVRLFAAPPMPDLEVPASDVGVRTGGVVERRP